MKAAKKVRAISGKQHSLKARPRGRPSLSNGELLDKALDLFLEQGFEGTSIDGIAAAAGMAKRTIYLRYGDKKSLFQAALERAIEDWIVPVEKLRAAESDDLEETLLAVGRILVANIMKPAGLRLLRITNAESGRAPEIGAFTYRNGTERTIKYLADLLRRRIEPGSADGAVWTEAAIAFMYLVVCGPPTMAAWGMRLDESSIDNHTVCGVRLFLHGVLAHQRPQPEPVEIGGLQLENKRLRELLLASMLEVAALKAR